MGNNLNVIMYVGCRVGLLSPKSMALIYKQYCQAIFKFGMECIYIDEKTLGEFNVRQNILLKTAVGIDSRCRTKPLLHCLKVEQINQVYHKHKVFGIKQFLNNKLSGEVYDWLKWNYSDQAATRRSFFNQIKILETKFSVELRFDMLGSVKKCIDSKFLCNDLELTDKITEILGYFDSGRGFLMSWHLRHHLRVFDVN